MANNTVALRVIVVLIFILTSCLSVFADGAFEFYVQACRHSGYNPVEIATFQAEIKTITKDAIPDSSIKMGHQSFSKNLEDALRKRYRERGMSEQRIQQNIERELQKIPHNMFKQMFSGEAQTNYSKVLVRNSVSVVGLPDTPARILREYQDGKIFLYSYGAEGVDSYRSRDDGHSIGMSKVKKEDPGMYHLAGRMQSPMVLQAMKLLLSSSGKDGFVFSAAGISAFKKDCEVNGRTFMLSKEKERYEDDHSAHILEVYEKGELQERFWIDSDRGYICPKIQIFEPGTQKISTEIVSENFVFDKHSQKWFPEKCSTDAAKEKESVIRYREAHIIPGTLVLNQPIHDSAFALTVQENARVDDARHGSKNTATFANVFIADKQGTLDLPTLDKLKNLDDVEWLITRKTRPYDAFSPVEKASYSWLRIMSILVGVIMIVLGLIMYFRKK